MAKTHYCGIDYPNESDNNTYYTPTVCGLEYCESPMTDKKHEVTCKNCLRVMAKSNNKAKAALPIFDVSCSLPDTNPHVCPECDWQCNCTNQPCSCCNDS